MSIIESSATDLNAGLAEFRPGIASRLSAWLMKRRAAAQAEAPLPVLDSFADESRLSTYVANNPHVVVAKLFMGMR